MTTVGILRRQEQAGRNPGRSFHRNIENAEGKDSDKIKMSKRDGYSYQAQGVT